VNMTMLDQRVAQIYVSTDRRTQGNTYNRLENPPHAELPC